MAKKNNRKSYDLRGRNNWETILNVVNAFIGTTMTAAFTGGHIIANGQEVILDKAMPEKVAKQIHKTATKRGARATWDSFSANKSTRFATDELYKFKDTLIGDGKKEDKYPFITKATKSMSKDERKAFKLLIVALEDKDMNKKDINKLLKLRGIKPGVLELANIASA